eukprot:1148429-Pelagomonas_calceolata.AAC.2
MTDPPPGGIERRIDRSDILVVASLAVAAALPFKTKPKLEAARKPGKRGTLEQRRAVVLEPHERRAATLLQQLNAIRNDKAAKRHEQQKLDAIPNGKAAKRHEQQACQAVCVVRRRGCVYAHEEVLQQLLRHTAGPSMEL